MALPLRIKFEWAVYHITSSGNARQGNFQNMPKRFRLWCPYPRCCSSSSLQAPGGWRRPRASLLHNSGDKHLERLCVGYYQYL